MGLAKRATEYREVLREDKDCSAINFAMPSYNTVPSRPLGIHAKVLAAVRLEHIVLTETALVEKQVEAFARGELALAMLRFNPLWPTSQTCLLFARSQLSAHGNRLDLHPRWLGKRAEQPTQAPSRAAAQSRHQRVGQHRVGRGFVL